jgi:transcriptional regulator with XRE-family HTH domain
MSSETNATACLGLVIRQRRIARGLSLNDFARLVGTHRPLVSRAENMRHVLSLKSLDRYARALECRPSELLAAAEELAAALREPAELVEPVALEEVL